MEARRDGDSEKNRLSIPVSFTGNAADMLTFAYRSLTGRLARAAESDFNAWDIPCRLNPAAAADRHEGEPQVAAGFAGIIANLGPALENLGRRAIDTAEVGLRTAGP